MAEGFKIADGYVEIHAALNRRSVRNATDVLVRDVNSHVRSNNKEFERTGTQIGESMGKGAGESLGQSFRIMGRNGYVVAGVAALVVVLAPLLATALTAAMAVGLAGMFAFITYYVRKKDKDFKKVWKDLTNGVKDVLKEASEPMVKPLLNSLKIITDAVKGMTSKLKPIFAGFGAMLEPFTKGLMGLVENMLPGISRGMEGFQAIFKALGEHLPKLGTAIGDFIAELTDDPELLERVVGLMITWLRNFLKVAGPIIEGLMVIFGGMANNWRAYQIIWDAIWDGVKSADPGLIDTIVNAFKGLWNSVKDVWEAYRDLASANTDQEITDRSVVFVDKLKALWEKLKETIKTIWEAIWTKVKEYWTTTVEPWLKEKMRALLDYLIDLVKMKFTEMKNQAVQKVHDFISNIITNITSLPLKAANAIASLPDKIKQKFVEMAGKAGVVLGQFVGNVITGLLQLPGKAFNALINLPSNIAKAFNTARTEGVRIASQFVSQAATTIGKLPSAALKALGNLSNVLVSAGRALINGFIKGINDKMPGITSAFANIKAAFKNAINWVIGKWNNLSFPGISVGGVQISPSIGTPNIGYLAKGGIAKARGTFVVGEEGPELLQMGSTSGRVTPNNKLGGGGDTYHFAAGSIVLDASKIESIEQLINMINSLKSTSRQFGVRPGNLGLV